ncbi:MAG: transporter, LysE family, partial [uncultured Craurococcus sp.]
ELRALAGLPCRSHRPVADAGAERAPGPDPWCPLRPPVGGMDGAGRRARLPAPDRSLVGRHGRASRGVGDGVHGREMGGRRLSCLPRHPAVALAGAGGGGRGLCRIGGAGCGAFAAAVRGWPVRRGLEPQGPALFRGLPAAVHGAGRVLRFAVAAPRRHLRPGGGGLRAGAGRPCRADRALARAAWPDLQPCGGWDLYRNRSGAGYNQPI